MTPVHILYSQETTAGRKSRWTLQDDKELDIQEFTFDFGQHGDMRATEGAQLWLEETQLCPDCFHAHIQLWLLFGKKLFAGLAGCDLHNGKSNKHFLWVSMKKYSFSAYFKIFCNSAITCNLASLWFCYFWWAWASVFFDCLLDS